MLKLSELIQQRWLRNLFFKGDPRKCEGNKNEAKQATEFQGHALH
jgi:hypothetical protein